MEGQSLFGDRVGAVSARLLIILAALIWLIGGGVLISKGTSLLREAVRLQPGRIWPWIGFPAGLLLGFFKGWYLFVPSCRKNLTRIGQLDSPRIWQVFSPGFFLALVLMITAGASLSRIAHGNYSLLILVGLLDLSIAAALLVSFPVYLPALRNRH